MCRDIGEPEESLSYLRRCITMIRELNHCNDEANALDELGVTYVTLRRYEDALAAFDDGIAIAQATGDRVMEASLLHHRGQAPAALGRPTEATAHWCRALEMYGDHEAGWVEEVEGLIRSAATAASTTALR